MKKLVIFVFILIGINLFNYIVHFYPYDFYVKSRIVEEFLINTNIKRSKIIVLETENINEFTIITGREYSYFSAVTTKINGEFGIITQPFNILKERRIFVSTLEHEILHVYLNRYFNLNEYQQEGIIYHITKDISNEFLYFNYHKKFYEEFSKFDFNLEMYLNHFRK